MGDDDGIRVQRNVEIDGKLYALIVTSRHKSCIATTAIHEQHFDRRIGGARFVLEALSDFEVAHLSSGMTLKCAAARIPADGQKTVVVCPDGIPDLEERARILGEHIRIVRTFDPGVIYGPDMANPEAVLDSIAEIPELLDHVTGLGSEHGGLAIDTNGYTAYGLMVAVQTVARERRLELRSTSIQGSGAVGMHTARLLYNEGIRINAIANENGTLISGDGGIDATRLYTLWQHSGDAALEQYFLERRPREQLHLDSRPEACLEVHADVFVPAARTAVLALPAELAELRRRENSHVRSIFDFLYAVNPMIVVEGANHPITPGAEMVLEQAGTTVLPDFLVNCGGLIGCFMEHENRQQLVSDPGSHQEFHRAAYDYIKQVVETNVGQILIEAGNARNSAQRIAEVHHARMLNPEH